jgi:Cu/Ag efflux protein CusF
MLASMLWAIFTIPGLQGRVGSCETEGTVLGIMADQGLILLDHEPIRAPGYFMGKMEMPFSVSDLALMNGLKTGDRVHFRVSEEKKSHCRHPKTTVNAMRMMPPHLLIRLSEGREDIPEPISSLASSILSQGSFLPYEHSPALFIAAASPAA